MQGRCCIMKYYVITSNKIDGMHCWKDAPEKFNYLKNEHRHIFYIRCWFSVTDTDREIEINEQQSIIERAVKKHYGNAIGTGAYFGGMSCEDIARWCIEQFGCVACEVLEDGFGGAYVRG